MSKRDEYEEIPPMEMDEQKVGQRPERHLGVALLGSLLFPPFGIIGFVYAIKVGTYWKKGKYVDAKESSMRAALCSTLGITFGIITWVVVFLGLILILLFYAIDWKLRDHRDPNP